MSSVVLMAEEDDWLHDIWTWYFHDPLDMRWTLESYRRLCDISTIDEFWLMHSATSKVIPLGMFFVMRETSFPCWDDASNIQGGTASIKVTVSDTVACWESLLKRMLGETLAVDAEDSEAINGISVSPKRGFCIIKIWTKDDRFQDKIRQKLRIPDMYTGDIIYRKNTDNIQNDVHKMSSS